MIEPIVRAREERLGEDLVLARTGGLAVLLAPKKGHARATGVFAVRFGSCDREFRETPGGETVRVPDGVAHFLEHKLFEGREMAVFARYAERGAYCNAATSFRTTHYTFTCTEEFEACLDILLDFVQNPLITPERVEKEKGIIEQELRMYLDNPSWRVFFNLLACLYARHPVRNPPGGTVESVRAITAEDCLRCHAGFYRPENMVLVASGDFDPDAILRRVEGAVLRREGALPDRNLPAEEAGIAAAEVTDRMVLSRARVALGFRDASGPGEGTRVLREELDGAFALELLFGRSSALYQDLYRRGVIDDTFSASATVEEDFSFTVLGGETSEPAKFRDEILAALARAREEGFSREDFDRVHRRNLGAAVRRYQSAESTAMAHLRDAFRSLPPFEFVRALEETRREGVERWMGKHLRPEAGAVSNLLPCG